MDNDLKKIQEAWRFQKPKPLEIDMVVSNLNKMERIFQFQKIFIPSIFTLAIITMLSRVSFNIYNSISIFLIFIGALFLIIPLFINKYSPIKHKFDENNQTFINNTIKFLSQKMLIPKLYLPIFILLFILAINIAFLGALNDISFLLKVLIHLSTILLLLVLFFLRNIVLKSYEIKISSLISKLNKLDHID